MRYSPRIYKDEPFYYDGIPDEELHFHLNNEFEKVINLKKYDVAFLTKNLLYDDGRGYVIFDPYIRCTVPSKWFGHFINDEEGTYQVDVDFISKKYIKPLPQCKYDSIFSLFKRQTSLKKNTDYFNV